MAINKRPEKRTGSNQGIFTNLVQKSRMGNTYSQSAKGNAITWHGRTSVSPVCLSPESLLWEWPPINQNCPHLYDPSCMARLEQWKLFAQRLRLTSPNYALTNADHTFIFNTVWITNQESGHEEMLSKRTSSLKWKIPPPRTPFFPSCQSTILGVPWSNQLFLLLWLAMRGCSSVLFIVVSREQVLGKCWVRTRRPGEHMWTVSKAYVVIVAHTVT